MTRAIGQSRAMEYILTGKNFTAREAVEWGLVSRMVDSQGEEGEVEAVVQEAVKVADAIGSKSRVAVVAAKNAVRAGAPALLGSRTAHT